MSVNLPRTYRVLLVITVVGVAFSTLGWSGDNGHPSLFRPVPDTIPARHPKQDRRAAKPVHKAEEGRPARELDLRIDAEVPGEWIAEAEEAEDMDLRLNLDELKGLNARIEADVLRNADALKSLEALKELDVLEAQDMPEEPDVLEALNSVEIDECTLQELKEMNIDEDVWNELHDLKLEMDDLRDEINEDVSKKVDDYRIKEEVRRVVAAVQNEIPRVRREVEKRWQ